MHPRSGETSRARSARAGAVLRWAVATTVGDPTAAGPAPTAADVVGLDDLADRAEFHRITPILHEVAGDLPGLDPAVADALAASYHHAVRTHLFALDDLAWLRRALGPVTADALVIKGPVLAELTYPRPDLRAYADLDVVVPAAAFADAVAALLAAGATFAEPDWSQVLDRRIGEVALALPSGTIVDLHWHLVPIGRMRDRFAIPMADLFARARVIDLGGARWRTLGTADTAVHLALHAALCGGDRLGWLVDLHTATRDLHPVDAAAVVDTARSWGAAGALAAQLDRARRLVDPRSARVVQLRTAQERTVTAATTLADHLQPIERTNGERTVPVALGWATSPTLTASAAELARMAGRLARRGGELDGRDRRRHVDRPPAPPSPRQWRDYLATVAAG